MDALADVDAANDGDLKLCLWEGDGTPLRAALDGARERARGATLLIGPEGGLARAEVDAATAAGFVSTSLGRRILRTETAALTIIAIVQAKLGDLGR